MITKIGVLHQDANSIGFLMGIKRRLQCEAEFVEPANSSLSKSSRMTRTQAKAAWRDLQKRGVDIIIRFTDADGVRWQDVKRHELGIFPNAAHSLLICGVAVENTEQWLSIDRAYVADKLDIRDAASISDVQITDRVKRAIARNRDPNESKSEFVARLVADAPNATFQLWLKKDDSFRSFYKECRAAAIRAGCPVPNELDDPESD